MNRTQILHAIESLAMSQGFYGRLLRAIHENREAGAAFLSELEARKFGDVVDLVLFLES